MEWKAVYQDRHVLCQQPAVLCLRISKCQYKRQNEALAQTIENALSDVMDAVLYVNQIYVDSLKASGRFDETAQKEAFRLAYTEALNLISDETKKIIEQLYGSFDKWLKLKIESSVGIARQQERT